MKKIIRSLIWLGYLPLLLSCNLYSPLQGGGGTQDLLERARRCEEDGDFVCAEEMFKKLPDGETKMSRLCSLYLTEAGVTLNTFADVLSKAGGITMLGTLAQTLVPYTQDKLTAAANALTECGSFATASGSATAVLLQSSAKFTHCAVLLAKTDQAIQTSNGDACATAGNKNGTLTKSDIAGMCSADVDLCTTDLRTLKPADLKTAGLDGLSDSQTSLPAELQPTATQATDFVRTALQSVLTK